MRKTHFVGICLLIWLLCSIPTAEAGSHSLYRDFAVTLQRIQTLLDTADVQDQKLNSFSDEAVEVQSLLTDLRASHLLLTERFRQQ